MYTQPTLRHEQLNKYGARSPSEQNEASVMGQGNLPTPPHSNKKGPGESEIWPGESGGNLQDELCFRRQSSG